MKCVAVISALGLMQASGQVVDPTDIASDADFPTSQEFIRVHRGDIGYSTEIETIGRFNAFKQNMRSAEERNQRARLSAKRGQEPAVHGVTKFMDLTPAEFTTFHKGLIPLKQLKNAVVQLNAPTNGTAQSIDWNAKGVLTPIKNQGQCGSCWAFSATEQLESQYKQKFGVLKELSPQQVTSCDKQSNGCGGGNPINAWSYVSTFGGQEPNTDYPYTSGTTKQTGTCKSNAADVTEDVTQQYQMIASQPSQESNMLAQIQKSPMSVCVDATLWQTYQSGVITASMGCGTQLDHAVQATGYNAEGNYWIVRNSWGETWGNKGFVYVEQGSNVCGITGQATTVTVDKIKEHKNEVMV